MEKKKEIRAVFDAATIRVYQAFCTEIAQEAVALGHFGGRFQRNRMTWIKPSFLWMMYRCGWAQKEGQEHVLAITMKREWFQYLVQNAVLSTYSPGMGISQQEWKCKIKESNIRCQWDPERDIYGNPLEYRSIQLGLRGEVVRRYVEDWIVGIEDITEYVENLRKRKDTGQDIIKLLPAEKVYTFI